jgi:hypothetical protein
MAKKLSMTIDQIQILADGLAAFHAIEFDIPRHECDVLGRRITMSMIKKARNKAFAKINLAEDLLRASGYR